MSLINYSYKLCVLLLLFVTLKLQAQNSNDSVNRLVNYNVILGVQLGNKIASRPENFWRYPATSPEIGINISYKDKFHLSLSKAWMFEFNAKDTGQFKVQPPSGGSYTGINNGFYTTSKWTYFMFGYSVSLKKMKLHFYSGYYIQHVSNLTVMTFPEFGKPNQGVSNMIGINYKWLDIYLRHNFKLKPIPALIDYDQLAIVLRYHLNIRK